MNGTGILREMRRNIASGTSRTLLVAALFAACAIGLMAADLTGIAAVTGRANQWVGTGASTYVIEAEGAVDGRVCSALTSVGGVRAAGALRSGADRLTFAALPSSGLPTYEATPGARALFGPGNAGKSAGAASGTSSARSGTPARSVAQTAGNGGVAGGSELAGNAAAASRDSARDSAEAKPSDSATGTVMLSDQAARTLGLEAGDTAALRDGGTVTVDGVYEWPDDGRQSAYGYAAITEVAATGDFDACMVATWPVPDGIRQLLLATVRDSSGTAGNTGAMGAAAGGAGAEKPVVRQLNTSLGGTPPDAAAFTHRPTAAAPLAMLLIGALAGYASLRARRLEMASALHAGVPKPALAAQLLLETAVASLAGCVIAMPVVAASRTVPALAGSGPAVADALARIPAAGVVGMAAGALLAVLLTRERYLFRYFKER